MKFKNGILVSLSLISAMNAYAGGAGGNGGPPAKESDIGMTEFDSLLFSDNTVFNGEVSQASDLVSNLPADNLLSRFPAAGLLKGPSGSLLIPLSEDNIRRLKLRASVTGSTPLKLDNGEKFLLQRDKVKDRLVDLNKDAEVIEKSYGIVP